MGSLTAGPPPQKRVLELITILTQPVGLPGAPGTVRGLFTPYELADPGGGWGR